jgi:methylmalonyl-CoA mutase C-terminal domain/subunit
MKENNMQDVLLLVGGVFPKEEIPILKKMGVDEVFMSTPTKPIISYLKDNVKRR